MADEVSDELAEETSESIYGGTVGPLDEVSFHEGKHRAETARKMAFLLVWIMAASVALHFVVMAILVACGNKDAAEVLGPIFNMWLPVISGLVSGAATYYFTRENQK